MLRGDVKKKKKKKCSRMLLLELRKKKLPPTATTPALSTRKQPRGSLCSQLHNRHFIWTGEFCVRRERILVSIVFHNSSNFLLLLLLPLSLSLV